MMPSKTAVSLSLWVWQVMTDDEKVAPVYERADQRMYDNKSDLKARKNK